MFQEVYRPPFDQWNLDRAKETWITLIEVYPAASMASEQFSALRWQEAEDRYADLDTSDENDAKRCSTTAACYGMTIGIIPEVETIARLPGGLSEQIAIKGRSSW